jgi:acetyltransferase-like isoleucine patch superfamily enzyme
METTKEATQSGHESREVMPEHRTPAFQATIGTVRGPQDGEAEMSQARREVGEDLLGVFPRLVNRLHSLWLEWTYPFASFGKNVSIHYTCDLGRSRANYVSLGDRVSLMREVWLNIPDVSLCRQPAIVIEDGCGIGRRSVISARNQIHVGRNTILGPSALVMDHNHEFEDVNNPIGSQGMTAGGTIRIEEGCWIGFGAAIVCSQGQLVIGRNSVIGANSVVSRSIPPYSVVTGNPARIVKQFDPKKGEWILGSIRSSLEKPAKES